MSKHINVNPNFYKVGGREHAEGHGEAVAYEQEKQRLRQAQSARVLPGQKRSAKKK